MKSKFTMNYAENMWDAATYHLAQLHCTYDLVGTFAAVLFDAGPRKRTPYSATLPTMYLLDYWIGVVQRVQVLSSCIKAGNSQPAAVCRQA